jgi:hypothetical protein
MSFIGSVLCPCYVSLEDIEFFSFEIVFICQKFRTLHLAIRKHQNLDRVA